MTIKKDVYHEIGERSFLLRKYFNRELNSDERKRLAIWLWADRRNRDLLRELREKRLLHEKYDRYRQIDGVKEFELLARRYPRLRKRNLLLRWSYVAAVLAVILTGGGIWFVLREKESADLMVKELGPSKVFAVLKMADGKTISIASNTSFGAGEKFQLKDSLRELVYTNDSVDHEYIGYHELQVPRGGVYKLMLADGTLVQLNSVSSIRFPEFFAGEKREVEISGNVYLQVAKDSLHPFVVRAGEYVTRVLGTHFAVRAYPDEVEWTTTLKEGSVEVSYHEEKVVLKPGQQAYLDKTILKAREVSLEKELSWVEGMFTFEHERLEQVVKELSRWYDVDFKFADERLKDCKFTGSVERDVGIEKMIFFIEYMNVIRFEKKEGYFLIKANDKARMYN